MILWEDGTEGNDLLSLSERMLSRNNYILYAFHYAHTNKVITLVVS
jgi:hypothetical protein